MRLLWGGVTLGSDFTGLSPVAFWKRRKNVRSSKPARAASAKHVPIDAVWTWAFPMAYVSHFTAVDNRNISFDLITLLRRAGDGICQLEYSGRTTVESFTLIDSHDPKASPGSSDHAEWKIELGRELINTPCRAAESQRRCQQGRHREGIEQDQLVADL